MITNEKQYRTTRTLAEKLRSSLADLDRTASDLPPILINAHREALDSQASELEADIAMYEDLRSGRVANFAAETFQDLPDILIRARIARGMTQKDLGDFIGVKEQQIQRYEAERYRSASLERLIEVAGALDVEIRGVVALVGDGRFNSVDPSVWSNFPITEMYKRGWFEDFSGSLAEAKKAAPQLVPSFLAATGADYLMPAMHRKSVRSKGNVLEAAFTAWEARVRTLAEQNPPEAEFDPKFISDEWIGALRAMSVEPDGVSRTVDHLRDIGISLIVERHLPGTLLDGAALCSIRKRAIVAMTLRHDRLDNFWFTLFHELGHLKLHIGTGKFAAIFDDTEAPADSDVEDEADLFAQEALIPTDNWKLAASRFARTERSVLVDAKRFGVGPAVIAGRIRREARNYTLLPGLVGSGEVRRRFGL
jgi:HTH-type transcriptional regulator/antitoxin HigA